MSMVLDTMFHIWFIMTVYNKIREILLQNATAILLQNATDVYHKMYQGIYYKMQQFYYKMRQLLQNATILLQMRQLLQNTTSITNCNSTTWNITITELCRYCCSECFMTFLKAIALLKTFEILETRDHLFSTCAKFSEKLKFPTLYTHSYVCVSVGKKC